MIRLLLTFIVAGTVASAPASAASCSFIPVSGDKDSYERLSSKFTSDDKHDLLRYTDQIGSIYSNEGVDSAQDYELHVVTVKSGSPNIHVKKSNKPLILFLAGEAKDWTLSVDPDAVVKRVYLVGVNNIPEVKGIPSRTEIDKRRYQCRNRRSSTQTLEIPYRWEGSPVASQLYNEPYDNFKRAISQVVGHVENSFSGFLNASQTIEVPLDITKHVRTDISLGNQSYKISEQQALEHYQKATHLINGASLETLNTVISLMESHKLPMLFPNERDESSGWKPTLFRSFTPLSIERATVKYGPEDNQINISVGDNIIEAGGGNDSIYQKSNRPLTVWMAKDRTIYVLNRGWGNDTFNIGCNGDRTRALLPSYGKDFWLAKDFKVNRFLVFGSGIFPRDMEWIDPFTIRNKVTKDSLSFTETSWCSHYVFTEDGKMPTFSWRDVYDRI